MTSIFVRGSPYEIHLQMTSLFATVLQPKIPSSEPHSPSKQSTFNNRNYTTMPRTEDLTLRSPVHPKTSHNRLTSYVVGADQGRYRHCDIDPSSIRTFVAQEDHHRSLAAPSLPSTRRCIENLEIEIDTETNGWTTLQFYNFLLLWHYTIYYHV